MTEDTQRPLRPPSASPGQPPQGWPQGPHQAQPAPYGFHPQGPYAAYPVVRRLSGGAKAVGWVLLGFSALIVLAAFAPWATVVFVSVSGTSGDGALTLILGLLAGAMAIVRGAASKPSGWQIAVPIVCVLVGALVFIIAVYDINNISAEGVGVGIGLPLTVLGGLGLIVAGIVGLFVRD